ncbi:cell division protein FtsL [uncultured Streptococcus sp.]|jgi:cell division protein ftsL|uniref:cell division protein FtsL n=1 Tax=uncultured Streptococcus sp. TaxID=83427 RepID=UPI000F233DED|nr:cell division protein FtsL [uncultured Streptococcus sp.]RKV96012.1 MAG: cell division protein FtsL [Streptococcus sp.]VTY17624.1 Cell division protein FtsL [uncultured Streptococcus sp.]
MAERIEKTSQLLQAKFKRFSRVEKFFYLSIAFTALVLAVSIIFIQTRLLQVQSDLTKMNAQIEEKKTELDDAKQEVNELIRLERLKEIANKKDLKLNNENIRAAE